MKKLENKKYLFDSRLGSMLYQLLPEVYRNRDKASGDNDLARYLDAHGHLLDLIYETFKQQLRDTLPESSQDWLLPYFARLLAADIISPHTEGKRAEVASAVSWRQRKGTLRCAEEIAEAVGEMEVELQEGWKRVAVTPHPGMPLMPADAWDNTLKINMEIPSEAARHPLLPAVMVDLRRPSRAVRAEADNPASRVSGFRGVRRRWRQANLHGAPCFPNSFDDVSRRTVDVRTPGLKNGHFHPKRLLAYTPPPAGFFPYDSLSRTWDEALQENLIGVQNEDEVIIYSNMTERTLLISNEVNLELDKNCRINDISFSGTLHLKKGRLELRRVVAKTVSVDTFSAEDVVLTASDCLFDKLSSAGPVKLDSCTILGEAYLTSIDAIDSIFMDIKVKDIKGKDITGREITGSIAYSRIPQGAPLSTDKNKMVFKSHNTDNDENPVPVFDDPDFILKRNSPASDKNGLTAYAVLSPGTPRSIYEGASDYGEMGCYHHGREERPVLIEEEVAFGSLGEDSYPLKDLIFTRPLTIKNGKLRLIRSAVSSLAIETNVSFDKDGNVIPSLEARDCLFDYLRVADGLARLEYCTIMKEATCGHLQASDCVFAGSIKGIEKPRANKKAPAFLNCIRYSAVPSDLLTRFGEIFRLKGNGSTGTNTLERPRFLRFEYCDENGVKNLTKEFGEPGYGVLDPATSGAIRFGAEDGGEMGAYHHRFYSLKAEAVLDKLREFLPLGIEPVLIHDSRLLHTPPIIRN